mmetsp:Transcript_78074/g.167522  ORF Transcript_78074/g.167522 Transcript_78074/m.167522 type:complete len:275 (-) Transcript_78074:576-1400(-)
MPEGLTVLLFLQGSNAECAHDLNAPLLWPHAAVSPKPSAVACFIAELGSCRTELRRVRREEGCGARPPSLLLGLLSFGDGLCAFAVAIGDAQEVLRRVAGGNRGIRVFQHLLLTLASATAPSCTGRRGAHPIRQSTDFGHREEGIRCALDPAPLFCGQEAPRRWLRRLDAAHRRDRCLHGGRRRLFGRGCWGRRHLLVPLFLWVLLLLFLPFQACSLVLLHLALIIDPAPATRPLRANMLGISSRGGERITKCEAAPQGLLYRRDLNPLQEPAE